MIELDMYSKESFTDDKGTTLPYRLYDPHMGKGRPLLVFLHGAGERGTDNEKTLNGVSPFAPEHNIELEKYGSYLLAPQCPLEKQWVNTPWANGSFDRSAVKISDELYAAKALIDHIVEKFDIDRSRIYIIGCSMGGFGTWDMISRFPHYFKAALPICGASDPRDTKPLADTPIWTFHGDSDPTVPVNGTREIYESLKSAGGDIIYTEIKGCGHAAWSYVYNSQCVFDWLFSR